MKSSLSRNLSFGIKVVLALAISSSAHAQLGGLLGKKDAPGAAAVVDKDAFGLSLETAAGKVLTARLAFLDSQTKLMEALGLKTDSLAKASEALRAKEGASSKPGDKVAAMKDSAKVTAEANKQFDEALAKSEGISDESKVKFAKGAGKFIEGVLLEKEQIEMVQKLAEQAKALTASANMMEKAKLLGMVKPATELALMVPGDVKEGFTTLGKIMKFAKKNNITEIPNAEKATAGLGDLDK